MKRILICMLLVVVASLAQAASFDCTKASTSIEKTICTDSHLSDLDSQLMQSYKKSLSDSAGADTLKSEQRVWLKEVRNKCEDTTCLRQAYSERIATLEPPTTAPPSGTTTPSAEVTPSASPSASAQINDADAPAPAEQSSAVTSQASSMASTQVEKKQEDEATSKANHELVRPDAGISGVFNGIYFVLVGLFLIGLVNPKWILRWDANANRKKLVGYFFVVAMPFGVLGEFVKTDATKKYEAKMRADKEVERQAGIAKQKAIEEEKAAQREYQQRSVEAARQEMSRPKPLWQRYYMAINANGVQCEQFKFVIQNWSQSGLEENQLNQMAGNVFAQARQAGCVQ